MLARPETQTPTHEAGGAVVENGVEANFYRNPWKSSTEIAVADAVGHVRRAGCHLREATFRLDEGGLKCEVLDDLAHDTAAIVAVWAGRAAPTLDPAPLYIVEAAREWRRQAGRNY